MSDEKLPTKVVTFTDFNMYHGGLFVSGNGFEAMITESSITELYCDKETNITYIHTPTRTWRYSKDGQKLFSGLVKSLYTSPLQAV